MAKIQHLVVLMLENRSFDHMFGGVDWGAMDVEKPTGKEFNKDGKGKKIPITFDADPGIEVGPDHGHLGVMTQLTGKLPAKKPPQFARPYNPDNSGFITSFEETSTKHKHPGYGVNIMKCHRPQDVSVLATLAKEFVLCDHWHCSLPGQTWPNRNYAHSGTSDGETNIKKRPFTNKTIFDTLDETKKSWRIYHDGIAQSWVFIHLWDNIFRRGKFRAIDKLEADIKKGDLPDYTFIEPRHFGKSANSQHPENPNNATSFAGGEKLIKRVYDALRSNKEIWNSTLLLITYDEHGGFYDHVPPPQEGVIPPDKKVSKEGFRFDMLGVRVPAVLVSPWLPRGVVDHTPYDHASIPRTVRELFAPNAQPLTNRDAAANSFLGLLTNKARTTSPDVGLELEGIEEMVMPVATEAAMKELEPQDALTDVEEPYAWLAYNVGRALRAEQEAGLESVAGAGLYFWESTEGRLITSKKQAERLAMLEAAPIGPPPVVVTDSDELSAFGQTIADMMHATAAPPQPARKPRKRSTARRR